MENLFPMCEILFCGNLLDNFPVLVSLMLRAGATSENSGTGKAPHLEKRGGHFHNLIESLIVVGAAPRPNQNGLILSWSLNVYSFFRYHRHISQSLFVF